VCVVEILNMVLVIIIGVHSFHALRSSVSLEWPGSAVQCSTVASLCSQALAVLPNQPQSNPAALVVIGHSLASQIGDVK